MSEQKKVPQKLTASDVIVVSMTPPEVEAQDLAATNYIRLLHLMIPGSPERTEVLIHLHRLQRRLQTVQARIKQEKLADDALLVVTVPAKEMLVMGSMMEAYMCTVKFANSMLPKGKPKPLEVVALLKSFYMRFLDEPYRTYTSTP